MTSAGRPSSSPRYVGGQAVVDGVMMRGATSWAVAVRRDDGEIALRVEEAPRWGERWQGVPFARGVMSLAESLTIGLRALTWSTEQQAAEADVEMSKGQLAGVIGISLALFVGLFVVFPAVVAKLVSHSLGGRVWFNLIEGVFRLVLFLAYLVAIGRIGDVRRLFQYHGAEHKSIAAYENGVELTPERAQRFSTEHVRCGTNFLLLVLVLAIVANTLVGRPGWLLLVASRVLLMPIVAGVAYEYIRFSATRMNRRWVRTLMAPGLALQRLTTREPTLEQLQVAIASLRAVLTAEQLAEVDARMPAVDPMLGSSPGLAPA